MHLQRWVKPLGVIPLVAAMLAATVTAVVAAPFAEGEDQGGVFGEVVAVDRSVLHVRTKDADIKIRITGETQFRARQEGPGSLGAIKPHDRIAAVVLRQGELPVVQMIMVTPQQATVSHITGMVTRASEGRTFIVTEDGSRVPVEFGSTGNIPGPGVMVTIAGYRGLDAAVVQVRSIQRLDETLKRLIDAPEEIQHGVGNREAQIQHLARVQRLLEKTRERQLQLLNGAMEHLPQEAQPALEEALQNLYQAEEAALRAFNLALELAGENKDEEFDGAEGFELEEEIEPTLDDLTEVLGLSEDALIERLGQGLTLAEIAAEAGLSQDSLVEAVLDRVRQRLERLVEKGHLSREDMERILDEMRQEANHHIHRAFLSGEFGPDAVPFSMEDLAQILGLEPPVLFARFHQGQSLLQIAQGQGLSREQLLEAITGLAHQRAQALVDQGVMRPKDVERFLRHLLKELEGHLEEVWVEDDEEPEDFFLTPEDIAAALDISVLELQTHSQDKATLEQLARRYGKTVEQLVSRILDKSQARLNHLVEEGKISLDEAQEIMAELKESLLEDIDEPMPHPSVPPHPGRPGPLGELKDIPFNFGEVARILDLPIQKLHLSLVAGRTLEDLAKERGLSLADLANQLSTPMEEKLQEMVKAGHLSEERARYMLQEMRKGILETLQEFQLPRQAEPPRHLREFRPKPEGPITDDEDGDHSPGGPITIEDAAKVLGISSEALVERMRSGRDIQKLLEERGFTPEQFVAALLKLRGFVAPGGIPGEKTGYILQELKRAFEHYNQPHRLPAATLKPGPTFATTPTPAVKPTATRTPEPTYTIAGTGGSGSRNILVLPHRFSGTVVLDGTAAPDGTIVAVLIDGATVASTTTSGGNYRLDVAQLEGKSFARATVSFTVRGFVAAQKGTWEAGGVAVLNLTASARSTGAP